jgi:AcrR family transcriptional regulator
LLLAPLPSNASKVREVETRTVGRPPSFSADELDARVTRAALREFSEHGYDIATIDAIAVASGVSKPVLYRAFGSKSELYCKLLERCANELASAAMQAFAHDEGSVLERFRAIIDSWFAVLETRPDQWRMLNTATSTDPAIRHTLKTVAKMQLRNDVAMIRSFLPGLPEAEVEPIAEAIRGSLIAIGTWWLKHPKIDRSVPVDAMTRICAGLFAVTTATS